ncbi:hypothetical protein CHL78_012045 [Romboutsia weinsteinii]|uniref:Uncharacterized protein n=1 Tax=Romboutsia weinsteinii TaxID=2020949 RepID=A0A371J249_9FIRM|nr:hypothetical protein [Romboutsia weinsteinii]RDY26795.1 hypothetical protein CHL78_012045 [Romboutsia weinsteinii]
MSEILGKKIIQKDIVMTSNNIPTHGITVSTSTFGYLSYKIDYNTTKQNELVYMKLDNSIDGICLNYSDSTKIVYSTSENKIYVLELNPSGNIRQLEYINGVFNKEIKRFTVPSYKDIIIYKKKFINGYGDEVCETRLKNGEYSEAVGTIFDEYLFTMINSYVTFGVGYQAFGASSSSKTFYNIYKCYDISNLGDGGQIIDPTISPKSVTQYRNGQEYRLLTEDMVVDPSKVDTSKAITLHPNAPRVLTEECLNSTSTTNTKDHKIHPKVNPVIQIDTTCEGCEKIGRD